MTLLFPFAPTVEYPEARAWFFDEGATVVGQVVSAQMDLATASCLAGPIQAAVDERYASKGRKVRYVHDWSACARYEVEARDRLLEWGRAGSAMTSQTIIMVSPTASPFIHIALSTGTFVMRRLGMNISVVDRLDEVVAPLAALGRAVPRAETGASY